jgi:hypothetical protein
VFAGPNIHQATYGAAMVPTPDGTGVVLIGGSNTLNDIYELKCSSTSCKWSIKKLLSVDRKYHVATYVPDSFSFCENYFNISLFAKSDIF